MPAAAKRPKKVNKCARGFHRVRHDPDNPDVLIVRCVDCGTKFVKLPKGGIR